MLSRRQFLRRSILYAAAAAAGNALGACSPSPTATPLASATSAPPPATTLPSPTAGLTVMPSVTPAAAVSPAVTSTATPIPPAAGEPYLVVARGNSPAAVTRAVIDALGGIKKFVKAGNDVILKPNICNAQNTFEYASTTNPDVLAELVRLCLAAGAKRVRVMDQPFSGTAVEAYKRSGIRDAVEKAGGEMEVMSPAKYASVNFPAAARDLKSTQIYQEVLKADVLINVPIAKRHNSVPLTISMKNLMGTVAYPSTLHNALDQRIADLSTLIKPTLNIVDGVRVLMNHGPTGGNLADVKLANTIIASHDPVAADAYAAQLLFDVKPETVRYLKFGVEMNLGRYDFGNLRIREVTA